MRTCLNRVKTDKPEYLADLEWLAAQRDAGAFISVADYRRKVLGDKAETMTFADDYAVTLEISALQYFPWLRPYGRTRHRKRDADAGALHPGAQDGGTG